MRPKFFCVPVMSVLVLVLTACGNSSSSSSTEADGGASDASASATSFSAVKRKAGETWTTTTTTTRTGETGTETTTAEGTTVVDFAGEGGSFSGRFVPSQGGESVSLVYDTDGQVVSTGNCSFTPSINYLSFPLAVGKKWSIQYTDCYQGRTTGTGEVVARKTIPSALGDLDTLEITTTVNTVTPVLGADRKPTGETTSSSFTQRINWSIRDGLWARVRIETLGLPAGASSVTEQVLTAHTPGK